MKKLFSNSEFERLSKAKVETSNGHISFINKSYDFVDMYQNYPNRFKKEFRNNSMVGTLKTLCSLVSDELKKEAKNRSEYHYYIIINFLYELQIFTLPYLDASDIPHIMYEIKNYETYKVSYFCGFLELMLLSEVDLRIFERENIKTIKGINVFFKAVIPKEYEAYLRICDDPKHKFDSIITIEEN